MKRTEKSTRPRGRRAAPPDQADGQGVLQEAPEVQAPGQVDVKPKPSPLLAAMGGMDSAMALAFEEAIRGAGVAPDQVRALRWDARRRILTVKTRRSAIHEVPISRDRPL